MSETAPTATVPTSDPPAPGGDTPQPKPATPPAVTLDTPGVRELVEQEVTGLKTKNGELLSENRALKDKVQEHEEKWKGMPAPEKVRLMYQRFETDEEAKLMAEGKVDEVVKRRVEAATKPVKDENAELQTQLTEANEKIAEMIYDRDVRKAAEPEELGIQPTAMSDIITRARQVFKPDRDGVLVADKYGSNGEPLRGVEGVREWLKSADLHQDAPHLYKPSKGGGTTGSVTPGRPAKPNPFLPGEHFNLTEQARLLKADPETARRLAAEAGVELDTTPGE